MALVLTHAALATVDGQDRVLADQDIRITGSTIAAIGPGGTLAEPGDTTIDCADGLVMPGFINTHTHATLGLFRGLADDKPRAFWPEGGYRVDGQERFTRADYERSLGEACAEFLLNGITTIADRVADMDLFAPIIEASGLRASVGSTLVDLSGPADWGPTERLIERYGTDPARSRLVAGIAPPRAGHLLGRAFEGMRQPRTPHRRQDLSPCRPMRGRSGRCPPSRPFRRARLPALRRPHRPRRYRRPRHLFRRK